jgi:hypothetical protein
MRELGLFVDAGAADVGVGVDVVVKVEVRFLPRFKNLSYPWAYQTSKTRMPSRYSSVRSAWRSSTG